MAAPPAVQPIKVQSSIKSHIVATTAADNEYLDKVMSEFFIGCNIPFNVIDHRLCHAMFAALRPGYKPPSRQSLSGKYLDKTHEQLQSTMKEKM